jgi:hypothetical protein
MVKETCDPCRCGERLLLIEQNLPETGTRKDIRRRVSQGQQTSGRDLREACIVQDSLGFHSFIPSCHETLGRDRPVRFQATPRRKV